MTAFALGLAYAGFTALALAMERHHRQVWHRAPARRTVVALCAGGSLLLALALLVCLTGFAGSVGVVVWLGVLTAAAVPLVFLLSYAPRAAAVAAVCAPLAASVAFAFESWRF